MDKLKTGKAARILWTVAGVLLLVVWVASMAWDDDRLCSSVPLCFGFALVALLGVGGMVAGARPARPTPLCLFGLAAGLCFLIRCVSGDMLSEIWRELPLILGCFVFYGAGYIMAQRRGGTALCLALALGVIINVLYLYLFSETAVPVEWKGRPSMSLGGANGHGCAWFHYRNFTAAFLMMAGAVLVFRPFWAGWKGCRSLLCVAVGLLGVACSFLCDSRSVLALPPLLLVSAWVLWALIRLYNDKEIGWGVALFGLALFVGVGVLLCELFMGSELLQKVVSVDTHGRTSLWSYVYGLLPQVPWCGYGAGASTWKLVPIIKEWALPNYAHNEYLQAWVDYGVVGMLLLVAVLLGHLASGFWSLASEHISRGRRALVAACILLLLSMVGCAVFEFVWHNVALAGLAAYACGVLASPIPSRGESLFSRRNWAAGSGPSLRPVQPVGRIGVVLCCIGAFSLAVGSACFAFRLYPAWKAQWEYNAMCHAGASEGEQVEFLERVMPFYPDPELVDHYVTLHPPDGRPDNVARKKEMLRLALTSNPHQLFTIVMLADALGQERRYAEAEELMREHYMPDGQPKSSFANWPGYYGMNLLHWGHQHMRAGDHATALSMMEYALNLWGHSGGFWYNSPRARKVADMRNKAIGVYAAARRVDVDMMRAIGVQKDDSWMQPMRPGGPAALYQRWGKEPYSGKFADPYSKRSPLTPSKK